jgi:hypothetical protein
MEAVNALLAQKAYGLDADGQMLANSLAVESVRHAAQLEFPVERFVRHA